MCLPLYQNMKRYTVTAALPYANGPLHLGHIAGAYLPADTYVRYLRLRGKDVIFICGSDEHGAAITLRARKEGTTPRAIVDKYHTMMRDAFRAFDISFDIYHRTSEPIHHQTSQEIFRELYRKGEFVEQTSEQYFDPEAGQFLADRYIMGTCPKCGHDGAYGDQCEKCGSSLSPTELISPRSTLSGATPVLKQTSHWFLPLDKYQPWVEEWITGKADSWKINVYGQCQSWLKGGLQPRAMTRDLDWGVDVPQEIPGSEGKKLYVWLDAPIGYVSATRQLFKELESGEYEFSTPKRAFEGAKASDWEKWWKDENTELIHFIGKDNIVFHCIIFPAILHAEGSFVVPENVPANEFLNLEGDKISTSRNWAVWLHEYVEAFPAHKDTLRYVLTSISPETKDSEFTWKDFQQRHNSELNAILSNFVHRVMVLSHKFNEGKVPDAGFGGIRDLGTAEMTRLYTEIEAALEAYRFREALALYMDLARLGNKFLTDREPWKKIKENPADALATLYECLELIGRLAVLGQIFLPETASRLAALLNLPTTALTWAALEPSVAMLAPGHPLGEAQPLFGNIEDAVIEAQIAKLMASKPVTSPPSPPSKGGEGKTEALPIAKGESEGDVAPIQPIKEAISFDDFAKMDLRVGTILEAARVPKADKLLQFRVDLGLEVRTIVSGVAEHFAPEDLVGKQVVVLANLAPRKIRGVESAGMILYAENAAGKLIRVAPSPETDNGSVVK